MNEENQIEQDMEEEVWVLNGSYPFICAMFTLAP